MRKITVKLDNATTKMLDELMETLGFTNTDEFFDWAITFLVIHTDLARRVRNQKQKGG